MADGDPPVCGKRAGHFQPGSINLLAESEVSAKDGVQARDLALGEWVRGLAGSEGPAVAAAQEVAGALESPGAWAVLEGQRVAAEQAEWVVWEGRMAADQAARCPPQLPQQWTPCRPWVPRP